MPSGRDHESDRFADDATRHERARRAGRGAPGRPGGRPSPDLTDVAPADRDLVAALAEAARTVPGPDPDARARMRAGVMDAITGGTGADRDVTGTRVLGEPGGRSAPAAHGRRPGPAGGRGAGRADRSRPRDERPAAGRPPRGAQARRGRNRLMANALAGFCAVLLLGALTVVISRGALPGQMLYGVKRASESVEMGLTSGPEARGQKNLDFAAIRLDEISGLISKDTATAAGTGPAAAGLDPATAALVAENLASFDRETRTGSQLLLPLMARTGGPLSGRVAEWARSQSAHLASIGPSLPSKQQTSVSDSRRMMDQLGARADAVDRRRGCPQASGSGGEDAFGPLPAVCGGTDRTVAAPSPSTTTSTTGRKTTTRSTTEGTTSSEDSSRSTTGSTSTTSDPSSSRGLLPPLPVPTPSAKAPVNVPLPVPGLPPVSVPPLVPGMPGLSLG